MQQKNTDFILSKISAQISRKTDTKFRGDVAPIHVYERQHRPPEKQRKKLDMKGKPGR